MAKNRPGHHERARERLLEELERRQIDDVRDFLRYVYEERLRQQSSGTPSSYQGFKRNRREENLRYELEYAKNYGIDLYEWAESEGYSRQEVEDLLYGPHHVWQSELLLTDMDSMEALEAEYEARDDWIKAHASFTIEARKMRNRGIKQGELPDQYEVVEDLKLQVTELSERMNELSEELRSIRAIAERIEHQTDDANRRKWFR